ncbi:phytase [Galbibacter sp. EGI 63066]|uniref:phytase n=1 Tax=Galbibacter sp. EGI 63066 TaxID=2993559 RepID=UPI002248A1D3|nr:phytase [Galbibacter sp. EGI 63066]MCX2681809.1 phytase [Galbibacter sp. EGI 63066]
MKKLLILSCILALFSCREQLPEIAPTLKTEKLPNDSDDPAIWVNKANPEESIVFGTDKGDKKIANSGVYAFDLDGKLIEEKSITKLIRPNNVDVEYDFKLNDSTKADILVFTERGRKQIRVFSVPDMKPLDNGGFKVFEDETDADSEFTQPMGVSVYRNPESGKVYAIVGRKNGPTEGYLYQYELLSDATGVHANLVRKFGKFSGQKEIEAIAVDDALGYVYYCDEGVGIHKYYADPEKGNEEISMFGGEYFKDDIEGIAIATYEDGEGYVIVSDQQDHTFNFFDRKTNTFIKKLNLGTLETDGCEVVTESLGSKFPNGLFVSMNDEKDFFYHALDSLQLK